MGVLQTEAHLGDKIKHQKNYKVYQVENNNFIKIFSQLCEVRPQIINFHRMIITNIPFGAVFIGFTSLPPLKFSSTCYLLIMQALWTKGENNVLLDLYFNI